MTLSELYDRNAVFSWVDLRVDSLPPSKGQQIETWLESGGMPGICFLRNTQEKALLFETWLDTTCYRDLQQIRGKHLSGDLAKEILTYLARAEKPTAKEAAAHLKVDTRKIKAHLDALEALFVVHRLDPHPLGIGKPQYLVFDAGIAFHLGASHLNRLKIWAVNECFAQFEYSGNYRPKIYYYESPKHSKIDLMIEVRKPPSSKDEHSEYTQVVLLSDEEVPSTYSVRALESFQKKNPKGIFRYQVLTPSQEIIREKNKYDIVPWIYMG
jgi:predicted AAA+ superfamily ATPase